MVDRICSATFAFHHNINCWTVDSKENNQRTHSINGASKSWSRDFRVLQVHGLFSIAVHCGSDGSRDNRIWGFFNIMNIGRSCICHRISSTRILGQFCSRNYHCFLQALEGRRLGTSKWYLLKVERIEIFNTILITPGDKTLFIPNGQVTDYIIPNFSTQGRMRLELKVTMPYAESFPRAKKIIE